MNRATLGALIALGLIAVPAAAQTYKCKDDSGLTVLQQTPCPQRQGPTDREQEMRAAIDARCRALKASETEFFRCGAELVCAQQGAVGESRTSCVRQMRAILLADEQRRAREDAERQSAAAAALASRRAAEQKATDLSETTRQPTRTVESDPVDCYALSKYAEAQGHGWLETSAIVGEAERSGRCTWNRD